MKRFCLPPFRALLSLLLLLTAATPAHLFAEANYVYHERTTADPGCAVPSSYVTTLNPSSAQSYPLRFKVEFQFFTDTARVYYTTNGSTPGGTFGSGNVGTFVVAASYVCTFGGPVVDVCSATIPAQPPGTVVKYIVSAWHSGGQDEIFGNGCGNCGTENSSSALATVHQYTVGSTTNLYWDINSATAGAGGATPTGTWDALLSNWSTVFDGTVTNGLWTAGRNAVFSAGTDASGAFTVTVSGTQTAGNILVEEGAVTLATGTASIGAGNVTVNSGATLVTDSSLRIAATAGATMTVNGGTVQTINAGAAGTFIDTDFVITLGAAGGTFSYTVPNVLNIVQTASKITGPGSLTKIGVGVLAFAGTAGNNDYTGGTIVNDGELRIRTVVNTLPITTAMTVNSPGILNLNNVSQQIGSLSGNGSVGTGGATLTISNSASTIFDGALKNIANAGAAGVTTGNGRLIKNGTGSITFNGQNDINGSVTISSGVINVSPAASLAGPIADLIVNGGLLNLSNAAQIIENLSSAQSTGVIHLATGHTLIASNVGNSAFSGSITGAGGILKLNNGVTQRTLTLTGTNSYDGNTIINGGIISVGSATALGSAVGYTEVASGMEVLFTGATANFTCAEPFRIAGPGGSDAGAIAVISSAAPILSGPVTLTADATITVSSSASATFSNPNAFTSLANQNLTLQGGANAAGVKLVSGIIALGSGSLTKLQGGAWILSGANTYSGGTLVSAGTLQVNNTSGSGTGSGAVIVTNASILNGTGTISGIVTIYSGATLAPGTSIGTLTLGSSPVLGGILAAEINKTGVTLTGDKLVVGAALAYGGTLTVTTSGDALTGGEVFDLFDASAFSGAFTVTNLPALGAGLNWWLGTLTTDGSITVNRAPTANTANISRAPGLSAKIKIADLMTASTSDLDGDARTFQSVGTPTNGTGTASSDATYIYYDNANALNDTFTYTIKDTRGGVTTGTISVNVSAAPSGSAQTVNTSGGGPVTVKFQGIVGYHYDIERSEDLMIWTTVATDVIANGTGAFQVVDNSPPPVSAYYRSKQH